MQRRTKVCQAYYLTGCTATGKSAVAHWLARRMGAAILSADSMLLYRGMDIGTAKPTPEERAEAPYAGLDLVAPSESCNLHLYYRAACAAVRRAVSRSQPLIIVGGTGLYLQCLLQGLDRRPPPDPAWREEAEEILRVGGAPALSARLREIAPEHWARLRDRNNPRRLMRAIEIARAAPDAPAAKTLPLPPPIPGLRLPPDQMQAAIAERARAMFDAGLLEETRGLLDAGLADAPTAGQAIGYAEAIACLRGESTVEEALERVIVRTRQLAKKQMTWFRHKLRVDWLEIDRKMPVEQRAGLVLAYWEKHGPVAVKVDNDEKNHSG